MNFLVLDTSGDDSSVILSKNDSFSYVSLPSPQQSSDLLPLIQDLLKHYSLTLNDIHFIAIGTGPGSFTGTRMGVITAKTLGFAKNIPLIPFCSLKRFLPKKEGPFLIIIDAKSQGFYLLEGEKEEQTLTFANSPELATEKELIPLLSRHDHLLSPHPERIQNRLKQESCQWTQTTPDFSHIITYSRDSFSKGEWSHHQDICVSY